MTTLPVDTALAALHTFADTLQARATGPARGEPEAQLSGPVSILLETFGEMLGSRLTLQAEVRAADRLGIPDFAASREGLLLGFIELKAPGLGADTARLTGRNRQQWDRFKRLPNLIYTDGNEWALYQNGERTGRIVRFQGDITRQGQAAISADDAHALLELFQPFLAWEVTPPRNARELAELLAPLCRALRDQVTEAVAVAASPLARLAQDWRDLLFPNADNARFADAYAQTVTYALLLARTEGADVSDISDAIARLSNENTMLARALQVMTDPTALAEIRPALRLIQRVIARMDPAVFGSDPDTDPWLYFYEDFLAAYDPNLRRDAGAYYTPTQVVHAQVRLVDDLLRNRLDRPMGFAEGGDVVVLDPAVGTGTYLLGVIEHAMRRVIDEEGPGAARSSATSLGAHLHGFELMTGPYAVAQLRFSQAITAHGGRLPGDGPPIYLTNTLDSPHATPPAMPLFMEPIAQEQRRALRIKEREAVLVCIGNPPYDRHAAATADNRAMTGGWVRFGDERIGTPPILSNFIEPAQAAGYGVHVHNLYNLYVYFWRWALWKVYEHDVNRGPGIVSFITASSYLDGPAFVGLREQIRRECDDVWIVDLGGEGRGTRRDENVFAIQTPVAIAITFRGGRRADAEIPATVHYTRIEGSRDEKLAVLEGVQNFTDLSWTPCPSEWHAAFKPTGTGTFYSWPLLTDLMPWQQSGVQLKRTWPIAPSASTLHERWHTLLNAADRRIALRETDARTIDKRVEVLPKINYEEGNQSISELTLDATPPPIVNYAYRSFDRQVVLADNRLADRARPPLWQSVSDKQIFLNTLTTTPLDKGPALTMTPYIPDLHHFRGSYGAKDVLPLYRDTAAREPNLTPGLLELLTVTYGREITPEDVAAYFYGVLAHPAFTETFADQLGEKKLRVPLTKAAALFEEARALGVQLLRLHTYGERFVPEGEPRGRVPRGQARSQVAVPEEPDAYPENYRYDPDTQTLFVGSGEFAPVAPEVYEFEVSGLRVVRSWLGYRMRVRSGRKSSPLDDIGPRQWTAELTRELLTLLWLLEATLELYPAQAELLERLLADPLFTAEELPDVPASARNAPEGPRRSNSSAQPLNFEM